MPNVNLDAQFVRDAVCQEGRGKTDYYDNAITGFILIVIVVVDALIQHRSVVKNYHARLLARVSPDQAVAGATEKGVE